ncbi:MAG: beta-galactosidase, partial [Blastochloris sp.]|nr:beta-galactosidase [Blastochloris sp.]
MSKSEKTVVSHLRPLPLKTFLYGSCYYPEHWDAATRALDGERMAAAGWNAVRMGEFAWDYFEPEEGRFVFDLFDETIELLGKKGIKTILGTPTASPPRWLSVKEPEILRVDVNGVSQEHGSRQHASHFSPVFREASRRITQALARHYAGHPEVIGWQTDNEFHCHFSEDYSPSAQAAFVVFLKERYAGIDALNKAWGTAFWAQTYRSFEEVPLPRPGKPTYVNPSHHLDYYRFLSWGVTLFQRDQVDILREANPAWFVFHNGTFGGIDYRHDLASDLDFLAFDTYPQFTHDVVDKPVNHAFTLDRMRSHAGNFLVPEHQSGAGGQEPYLHDTPEPGEMRCATWTSIAHGADGVLYFRWRTCRFGAEIYWHGILDHDNVPRRRLEEATQIGREVKLAEADLLGTSVRAELGLALDDYVSGSAHRTYSMGLPGSDAVAWDVHAHFWKQGYLTGAAHPSDDLSGFKLYVLPHLVVVVDPAWVSNLESYVRGGGILVVGARSGCRNTDNQAPAESLPGVLASLCGVTVEEYGRQNER